MLSSLHAWGAKIKEFWDFLSIVQETVGAGNCPQSVGSPSKSGRPPPWALLVSSKAEKDQGKSSHDNTESSSFVVWFAAACSSRSLAGETALQKGMFPDE